MNSKQIMAREAGWIILFFSIIGFVQIFFLPRITLNYELGYDGIWYIHVARKITAKSDSYHIFRLVPAFLCYGIMSIIKFFQLQKIIYLDEISVFQLINLTAILISVFYSVKTAFSVGIKQKGRFLFYLIIYSGFYVLRDPFFNPVMTDTFSFMELMILFYYLITGTNNFIFWIWMLVAVFTNPFIPFIILIVLIFRKIPFTKIQINKDWPVISILISICLSLSIFMETIYLVYQSGISRVYSIPAELNPQYLIYIIIFNCLIFFIFFYQILKSFDLVRFLTNLRLMDWKYIIVLAFLFGGLSTISNFHPNQFNNNNTDPRTVWLVFYSLKPAIGIIDTISYFGLLPILFLLNFKSSYQYLQETFGASSLFLLLGGVLFFMKPEARHCIFLVPFIALSITKSLETTNIKYFVPLGIVAFLFSKLWYPLHWSEFSSLKYQEYPAQHYLAFLGPAMAWEPYFIFSGIFIVTTIILYQYNKIYTKI